MPFAFSFNPARQPSQAPLRLQASAGKPGAVSGSRSSRSCALLPRPQLARVLDSASKSCPRCSSVVARAAAKAGDDAAPAASSSTPRVAVFSAKPYVRDFLAPSLECLFPDSRFVSARLDETTAALAAGCDVAVAFVNDSADAAALRVLKEQGVGLVALRCAGFDCVDVEAAKQLGLKVLRVPTYSPTSVAEHSVALALSLARRIPLAHDRARFQNYELSGLVGFQLKGKTVGIWGTGAIGTAAVAIYKGLGCRVLVRSFFVFCFRLWFGFFFSRPSGLDPFSLSLSLFTSNSLPPHFPSPYSTLAQAYDRVPNPSARAMGAKFVDSADDLLEQSDVLSLHVPLNSSTKHLINAESLQKLKPGAMIINVSRGGLIDTGALIDAIDSGRVGAVALDVYEGEAALFFEDLSEIPFERRRHLVDRRFQLLMSYPNVLVTPHGEEERGKGEERARARAEKKKRKVLTRLFSHSLSLKTKQNSGVRDDGGPGRDRPRRREEHPGVVGVEAGGSGPGRGAGERGERLDFFLPPPLVSVFRSFFSHCKKKSIDSNSKRKREHSRPLLSSTAQLRLLLMQLLHPQNAHPKRGKLSMRAQSRKLVADAPIAAAAPPASSSRPLPLLLLRFRRRRASLVVLAASAPDDEGAPRPPHVVLGVPASASAAEARRAWRARALEVHPDVVVGGGNGDGSGNSGSGNGDESALLELNEAYAAFLRLRGVRSRGAVGKEGSDEDDDDGDDDPFLPPLFSSSSSSSDELEERRATFLFVDPFSIPNFDPFRWKELQDLLKTGGEEVTTLTPDTAADTALALLLRAGVARMPPRSGVALLTARQLAALEAILESSLATMDLAGGAFAVSEALARARVANSSWRRRRPRRKREM